MKLGSLFDGSGGFPLAGALCGIAPVWASEVEPYPIAVTRSRFPGMKHLGDISKINGAEIEPVDIVTFGSPCQDLSVAGKRAGLKHEANGDEETTRSGLFMEAVRIIREMRKETSGRYPTIAIWENVPGAFSSNKGEDFRVVLEELIKIVQPQATVPAPDKHGWAYADVIMGEGWSLAWRVFDAQHWRVPQRRRRIQLVFDLGGGRAAEMLFEREGLRGYFAPGEKTWQGVAGNAENGVGGHEGVLGEHGGLILDDQGGQQISVRTDGICPMLRAETHGNLPCVLHAAGFKAGQGAKAGGIGWEKEKAPTLASESGGNSVPSVCYLFENHSQDARYNGPLDVCPVLSAQLGTGRNNAPLVVGSVPFTKQAIGEYKYCNLASTLAARDYKDATDLVVSYAGVDCRNLTEHEELYPTLQAKPNGGQSLNFSGAVRIWYIVRRLMEKECARLQGFPDWWGEIIHKADMDATEADFWNEVDFTHRCITGKLRIHTDGTWHIWSKDLITKEMCDSGKSYKPMSKTRALKWYNKLHTSSAEYKMWGNGIALPPALYVIQGVVDALERYEEDECGRLHESQTYRIDKS